MSEATATPADRPEQTHQVAEFKHDKPAVGVPLRSQRPVRVRLGAGFLDPALGHWPAARGHVARRPRQLGVDAGVSSLGQHAVQRRLRRQADLLGGRRRNAHARCAAVDAHNGWVRAVAVSPDGNLLATSRQRQPGEAVERGRRAAGRRAGRSCASRVQRRASIPRRPVVVSGDLKGVVRELGYRQRRRAAPVRRRGASGSTTRASAPISAACAASPSAPTASNWPAAASPKCPTPSPASARRWSWCSISNPVRKCSRW